MPDVHANLAQRAAAVAAGTGALAVALDVLHWIGTQIHQSALKAYPDTPLPGGTSLHNPLSDAGTGFPFNLPTVSVWLAFVLFAAAAALVAADACAESKVQTG